MATCLAFIAGFSISVKAHASAATCDELFSRELYGARYVHQRDPSLHKTSNVEREVRTQLNREGTRSKPDAIKKVAIWMDRLEAVVAHSQDDPELFERVKASLLKDSVIREDEIPENYFELQIRLARQLGHGPVTVDPESRHLLAHALIEDQKQSLGEWIDYLFSKDSSMYPTWAKYWCYSALIKLGKMDTETFEFEKRSRGQVAPFPELNPEALSLVMGAMVKKVNGLSVEQIQNQDLLMEIAGGNFGKLYGIALASTMGPLRDLAVTRGHWVTFPQGSDAAKLVATLRGMNTGWCTAGIETARSQLKDGAFHIYYSNDESGRAVIPRIAMRMEGSKIGEIRGIAKNQNMDSAIAASLILPEKLATFGTEGAAYLKRSSDMKRMTEIERRVSTGSPLTVPDLRFLYEIDEPITGFGQQTDPRVKEFLSGRNQKTDLVEIFGRTFTEKEITIGDEYQGQDGVKLHVGNVAVKASSLLERALPEIVIGDLNITGRDGSDETFDLKGRQILPKLVRGTLFIGNVKRMKNWKLPEVVGRMIHITTTVEMVNVRFPRKSDALVFNRLKRMENVELPVESGRILMNDFAGAEKNGILKYHEIKFPETVHGDFVLQNLVSGSGITMPKVIDGEIRLRAMRSLRWLDLPSNLKARTIFNEAPEPDEKTQLTQSWQRMNELWRTQRPR